LTLRVPKAPKSSEWAVHGHCSRADRPAAITVNKRLPSHISSWFTEASQVVSCNTIQPSGGRHACYIQMQEPCCYSHSPGAAHVAVVKYSAGDQGCSHPAAGIAHTITDRWGLVHMGYLAQQFNTSCCSSLTSDLDIGRSLVIMRTCVVTCYLPSRPCQ
jgi:hypothetical protein